MIRYVAALLFLGLFIAAPAQAQVSSAYSVSSCGGQSLPAGQFFPLTMDLTGKLCDGSSGGGGGSNVVIVPSGSASTGIVPVVVGPAVNSAVLKAAPGNFYGLTVTPTSAVYIFLINATSLPANATLTPGLAAGNLQECVGLAPANLTSTFDFGSGPSEVFSTGITVALSSTACPVLTASAVGTINGRAQ